MVMASSTQRLATWLGEPSMISIRVCLKPEVIIFLQIERCNSVGLKDNATPLKEWHVV
jgi:hypothetical protein